MFANLRNPLPAACKAGSTSQKITDPTIVMVFVVALMLLELNRLRSSSIPYYSAPNVVL